MRSLKKFTKSRLSRLEDHMLLFHKAGDPEELHHVRVEIKKIKAVLLLVEECIKGFSAHKHFIPYREIFRQAGAVREPEVARKLAARFRIHKQGDASKSQVQVSREIFDFEIPVFVKRVRKHGKEIVRQAGEVTKKDFAKTTRRVMGRIKENLYPELNIKRLHKTRKKLKEMLHLSEVSDILSKKETKFYSTLEEMIGRHHDKKSLFESGIAVKAERDRLSTSIARDEKRMLVLISKFYAKRK